MNLNAINQIRALVNKNIPFSNTRKPDLINAFKLLKITFWKCFNFVALENVKNEKETDAASAACFQNITYQVDDNVWSLEIRSGIVY